MRIMAPPGNEVDEPLHTDGGEIEIPEVSLEVLGLRGTVDEGFGRSRRTSGRVNYRYGWSIFVK